jgi:2-dehydro-3-deoxygluconokinase
MYDVLTLGETMLRLTPPAPLRIQQTTTFNVFIGGAESNLAVGLCRLGFKVGWISRLTDNPMGRLIAGTLAGYGVDTSHVIWTEHDRVGTYFVEEGKAPRASRVFYDRANSAMANMTLHDLPAHLFKRDEGRLLHLTGITPAIGAGKVAWEAARMARAAGWKLSFDVNYRSKLWSPDAARQECQPFMQVADLIFISRDDAKLIYGTESVETLAKQYPKATLVMTAGSDGSYACEPDGEVYHQPMMPAEEAERIGGGDAFDAGFLYGYLTTEGDDRMATALRWAAAVAALKYTIVGDMPLVDRADAETLVKGDKARRIVR